MNYLNPLMGGALIGLSALLLYAIEGKIAGITGIVFGTMRAVSSWRVLFLVGLIGGGWLATEFGVTLPVVPLPETISGNVLLAVAGLLVGIGTRMANGCTSGHGVCGLAQLSPRSFVAVATFMGFGMLIATLLKLTLR